MICNYKQLTILISYFETFSDDERGSYMATQNMEDVALVLPIVSSTLIETDSSSGHFSNFLYWLPL